MKILVVDDVPMYVEMLREPLARAGFSPVVATSAAEARVALAQHRPRLALIDLHMPGDPGDRLCRELKAAPGAPAVVVLGVGGREEDRRRAEAAFADAFLEKPVRPDALLAAVTRFLRVRERRPRVALRVPVICEAAGFRRTAQATNLSSGGLFLATADPLLRGTPVTLELRLPLEPSGTPLRVEARVSWTTAEAGPRLDPEEDRPPEAGMGVEFTPLSDEVRAAVERFVARSLAAARVGLPRFAGPAAGSRSPL